jgi:hypothetical protein
MNETKPLTNFQLTSILTFIISICIGLYIYNKSLYIENYILNISNSQYENLIEKKIVFVKNLTPRYTNHSNNENCDAYDTVSETRVPQGTFVFSKESAQNDISAEQFCLTSLLAKLNENPLTSNSCPSFSLTTSEAKNTVTVFDIYAHKTSINISNLNFCVTSVLNNLNQMKFKINLGREAEFNEAENEKSWEINKK